MIVTVAKTSQSIDVQIVDDTGLAVTGLVANTFPAVSWSLSTNTAATAITLSNLAAITTAYTSGGIKERSGGYYRLDIPNAALATAGEVTLIGEASGKHLIAPRIIVGAVEAAVQSITTGNGAFAITVHVTDGITALGNVSVRFAINGVSYFGTTNGSGNAVFSLDAGSYTLSATKGAYSYTPTTQTISALATINVVMTASSALTPSSSQSTGSIITYDANDAVAAAVIIEYRFVSLGTAGRSYPRGPQTATSDSGGLCQILLRRLAYYEFRRDAGDWTAPFLVPDASTCTLPEVLGKPRS